MILHVAAFGAGPALGFCDGEKLNFLWFEEIVALTKDQLKNKLQIKADEYF